MLVLSRKTQQTVVLGGSEESERRVKVTVLSIKNGRVKLGFEGPSDIRIHRCEIMQSLAGDGIGPTTAQAADCCDQTEEW